jgi:hypothetical protein
MVVPMRVCLLLLLLFAGSVSASDRYRVEVLVFAYNNASPDSALTDDDPDPDLSGMLMGSGGDLYSTLPLDQRQLNGANDALARHARTRALVHTAWVQDSSNRRVRLRGDKSVDGTDSARGVLAAQLPELDGDVVVRIGRGIEVDLNVLLRTSTARQLHRYQLKQKRVVLAGDVSYFDHPALGVIVRVDPETPAEAPL